MGSNICKLDNTKMDSDVHNKQGVTAASATDQKNFNESGHICFENKKYPEAAFWYFQEHRYRQGGADSMQHLDEAIQQAGTDWDGFKNFLQEHHKHGTISDTTEWSHVEMLWNNMEFERKGGRCYNNKEFPEAAFWFFQHKMHRLEGVDYSNVPLSVYNAGEKWKDFDKFLETRHTDGRINADTGWEDVQKLWQERATT